MAKRVLVLAPAIRRGGGPAGYVYNQTLGYQALQRAGKNQNEFVFLGGQESCNPGPRKNRAPASAALRSIIVSLGLKRTVANLLALLAPRQRRMRREIGAADVVVFHGPYNTHLAAGKSRHARLIYMPHSPVIAADEYRDLLRDAGRAMGIAHYRNMRREEGDLIGAADRVVFPSPGARAEYQRQFPERLSERSAYIKSGGHVIASNGGRASDIATSGKISVLYAGRYVSHRGCDLFCGAARRMKESGFEAEFYAVGSGPLKIDTQSVRDLGWRDDIFEVIRAVDIVVVPNRRAYCDLFPIECAALGKPMIISRVGGNAELAKEFPDVIPCEPTIESVTDAIRSAVETFKARPNWGERNRVIYESDFTAECLARRWDDFVSSLPASIKPRPKAN